MRRSVIPLVLMIMVAAPFAAVSQDVPTLGLSTTPAKVDGVFGDKEYVLVTQAAGIKVGLTWTAETLYLAVSAPTTGWVAAGVGSAKMDGAVMYLGHAAGSSGEMKVQKGMGHRHADTESGAPLQYAVKEVSGSTVLELALPSKLIAADQKTLELIFAMGTSDSFASFHKSRAAVTVDLAR
jgi:hypothetical protein